MTTPPTAKAPTNNFGHIKEPGVLLLTKEDSDLKHKRNALLAGASLTAFFTLGLASPWIIIEGVHEDSIRRINKVYYPDMPYSTCVKLYKVGYVAFNGKNIRCPIAIELDEAEKRQKQKDEQVEYNLIAHKDWEALAERDRKKYGNWYRDYP